MIPYARLAPGWGWQPFRAFLYYLQRIVVLEPLRRAIARGIAAAIRMRRRTRIDAADAIGARLADDGCVRLPWVVPEAAVSDMLSHLAVKQVVLRDGSMVAADRVPAGQALADFPLATVLNCPHVMELANDPRLLRLAATYLGCTPTISSIGLRWSYPAPAAAAVQRFHRDTDEWRILKFFAYLTDVDEESGPHVFLRGSHRESRNIFALRYSDDEIKARYPAGAPIVVTGGRGTMFLADTAGIHKGELPISRPRLLFEVGFTLLPVFCFRYAPERLMRGGLPLDRYINRLIVA
jgi:hypothetical protein